MSGQQHRLHGRLLPCSTLLGPLISPGAITVEPRRSEVCVHRAVCQCIVTLMRRSQSGNPWKDMKSRAASRGGGRRDTVAPDPQGAIGITGSLMHLPPRVHGALTVKYSFSNGSFQECPSRPKTATMGAKPPVRPCEVLWRLHSQDRPAGSSRRRPRRRHAPTLPGSVSAGAYWFRRRARGSP